MSKECLNCNCDIGDGGHCYNCGAYYSQFDTSMPPTAEETEINNLRSQLAAANATLDKLREIVDKWYNNTSPTNTGEYDMAEIHEILYPKEPSHD